MTASITPIGMLVADAGTYLQSIAGPAVKSAIEDPGNPHKALAAFILLYHAKDWSKHGGVPEDHYWKDCPYAQLMGEIANGGKHQEVTDRKFAASPVVLEFRRCGYGQGGYGVGPYGVVNIQVHHRSLAGEPEWLSLKTVLEAVLGWWTAKLQPAS